MIMKWVFICIARQKSTRFPAHAMYTSTIFSSISDTRSFFLFLTYFAGEHILVDILHLTGILIVYFLVIQFKLAVVISWHRFINDSLNNDKSLSVVFRLSWIWQRRRKKVTVVVNRVRRRLKKHMRLVLIVAPVNRHEEQYFTSHTYTYRKRKKEKNY